MKQSETFELIIQTRKQRKAVLEGLGFIWDRFNALHARDPINRTRMGANVTCISCGKYITMKSFGGLFKRNHTILFLCKDIVCHVMYVGDYDDRYDR